MKSPNFPWLEHCPANWEVVRLKSLFGEHKNKNHGLTETNLLSLSYGQIVQRDINQRGGLLPESFEGYNIVEPNDIVLRLTDLQNDQKSLRTGLVRERGIITSAYVTLRPRIRLNVTYFEALLKSYDFRKVFYSMGGGVRQSLTFSDVSSLPLLVPTGEEQAAIVDFLSYKTAEIDGLIGNMARQVELLERYRRELIARTVTRGLDSDASMKDSGIDWIGEVPTTWRLLRIAALYDLRSQKVSDKDYPPLSITMNGVVPQLETVAKTNDGDNRKLVKAGDLVINSRSDRRGACGIAPQDGSCSLINIVLAPQHSINSRYFSYLFRSALFADEFYRWGHGIHDDIWTTKWSDMKSIQVPVPPLKDQEAIANYLDDKMAQIDSTVAGINKQIELLGRYRKQVINDLVTGKVRVGEVA